MARKRMIDPSIWQDEGMASLTPRRQLLYIGLFSNADDEGRMNGSPVALRLILPTLYSGVDLCDVESDLAAVLTAMDKLIAYEVDGKRYLAFTNYQSWQTINRPQKSKLPAPITDQSRINHGTIRDRSLPIEKNRREEKRREYPPVSPLSSPPSNRIAASADAEPPPKSIPKPNRISEFVDAVKSIDPETPVDISARDGAAIKASSAKPERLAQAYVAAYRGEWGDDWFRDNLSPQLVVTRIAGFEAHLRAPPRSKNGQTAVSSNDLDRQKRRYATTLAGGPAG